MTTVTIKFPDALARKLAQKARKLGRSKSAYVRDVVAEKLSEATSRKRVTMHDLMREVCGSIEGPGDLASNKKYMEGYGK